MSALRAALITAICLSMFGQEASAQPRGGASERDRGILGRVGARRDERLGRNAPTPPPGNANPAVNPNLPNQRAAANPAALNGPNAPASVAANPLLFGRAPGNAPGARGPMPNPQAYPNNSRYGNTPLNNRTAGAPTPAPLPQAGAQTAGQRSALYPPAAGGRNDLPYSAAGSQLLPDDNSVPTAPGNVRSASADAPLNKLPYNGPGVLVRLPRTIAGEVNYLVDDTEHLVVHSGEDQLLKLKGSYEVRFSRGVTDEGRSYGEARYTITEGVYRFDVSANGWELYREGEAGDVAKAIAEAQKRADEFRRDDQFAADKDREAASTSLPPLMAPRDTDSRGTKSRVSNDTNEKKPDGKSSPPVPVPPVAEEDTLPAPKSILEPS